MRRQQLEIMAQILAFCMQKRRKTHIMYATKLNHKQLRTYLTILMSQDLLASHSDRYATTEKGRRFLDAFLSLSSFFRDDAHLAFFDMILKTYREAQVSGIEVSSQVETGSRKNSLKKAAIIVLISLIHEEEKKSRPELEIEIRRVLEENFARTKWMALEDVIVVEEEHPGAHGFSNQQYLA